MLQGERQLRVSASLGELDMDIWSLNLEKSSPELKHEEDGAENSSPSHHEERSSQLISSPLSGWCSRLRPLIPVTKPSRPIIHCIKLRALNSLCHSTRMKMDLLLFMWNRHDEEYAHSFITTLQLLQERTPSWVNFYGWTAELQAVQSTSRTRSPQMKRSS